MAGYMRGGSRLCAMHSPAGAARGLVAVSLARRALLWKWICPLAPPRVEQKGLMCGSTMRCRETGQR